MDIGLGNQCHSGRCLEDYILNKIGEVCRVEFCLRTHERDSFLCYASRNLIFGVCFLIELAGDLTDAGHNQLLTWLIMSKLIIDLTLKPLYSKGVLKPFLRLRHHEIGVLNDPIHQQSDLHEKIGVADPNSASADVICAGPAFFYLALGADVPNHGSSAYTASNAIPH